MRDAHRDQPGEDLPCSIDIVDAPAAEPTAIGLLVVANELDGPIDVRIAQAAAKLAEGLQHAAAKIGRAGIDHGVVIGERHIAEKVAIVVAIERAPAAVAILHGEHPAETALDGGDGVFVGWAERGSPTEAVRFRSGSLRLGRTLHLRLGNSVCSAISDIAVSSTSG